MTEAESPEEIDAVEEAAESDEGEEDEDLDIRQRTIDVTDLFETFLEEDDPQTTHMVLFRVAEIVLNRAPGRLTQDLMKMLLKAGDSAARARLELDPDLASRHDRRFERRKLQAYEIAASIQEI